MNLSLYFVIHSTIYQRLNEVKKTFQNVHQHLSEDGLFLFDVHSPYQMEHVFMESDFHFK